MMARCVAAQAAKSHTRHGAVSAAVDYFACTRDAAFDNATQQERSV
jgi:hypothetical protein